MWQTNLAPEAPLKLSDSLCRDRFLTSSKLPWLLLPRFWKRHGPGSSFPVLLSRRRCLALVTLMYRGFLLYGPSFCLALADFQSINEPFLRRPYRSGHVVGTLEPDADL